MPSWHIKLTFVENQGVTAGQKLSDNNIVSLEMSSISMSYYIFYLLESFVKKKQHKEARRKWWRKFFCNRWSSFNDMENFSMSLFKAKGCCSKQTPLSHVHISFVCVVLVMALANASHFRMPLLRLSNCHD